MSDQIRFVYGFEHEQEADAFLGQARAAGYEATLDTRDDGIEAVSVVADESAEPDLDHLAEQSFGHSLGGRPAD
jgi:hypothetical protein